jgi:hypothetical protein
MKTKTKTQHYETATINKNHVSVFKRIRSLKNFKVQLFTNVNPQNSQARPIEENIAHEYLVYQLEAAKAYVNMPPR